MATIAEQEAAEQAELAKEAEEQSAAEAKEAEENESEAKAEQEEEEHEEANESREVSSEMVASWGYNEQGEELEVVFVNGHEESYSCSVSQWEDAKSATSAGKWMHENML